MGCPLETSEKRTVQDRFLWSVPPDPEGDLSPLVVGVGNFLFLGNGSQAVFPVFLDAETEVWSADVSVGRHGFYMNRFSSVLFVDEPDETAYIFCSTWPEIDGVLSIAESARHQVMRQKVFLEYLRFETSRTKKMGGKILPADTERKVMAEYLRGKNLFHDYMVSFFDKEYFCVETVSFDSEISVFSPGDIP